MFCQPASAIGKIIDEIEVVKQKHRQCVCYQPPYEVCVCMFLCMYVFTVFIIFTFKSNVSNSYSIFIVYTIHRLKVYGRNPLTLCLNQQVNKCLHIF